MTECCSATAELWSGLSAPIPRGSSLESRKSGPERPATAPHPFRRRVIYPSRRLCDVVQAGCAPIMDCCSYPWPASQHCGRFPSGQGLCVEAISDCSRPAAHVSLCTASRLVPPPSAPPFVITQHESQVNKRDGPQQPSIRKRGKQEGPVLMAHLPHQRPVGASFTLFSQYRVLAAGTASCKKPAPPRRSCTQTVPAILVSP